MKIHIVQKGDTLWGIAKQYGVDIEELKQLNSHLSSPDMIMPGMKIKVPSSSKDVKTKEKPKKKTSDKNDVDKVKQKKLAEEKSDQPEKKQVTDKTGQLQPLKQPQLSTELSTESLIIGSKKQDKKVKKDQKEYKKEKVQYTEKAKQPTKQHKKQHTMYKQQMMPLPSYPSMMQPNTYPICCHCMLPYYGHHHNLPYHQPDHHLSQHQHAYERYVFN